MHSEITVMPVAVRPGAFFYTFWQRLGGCSAVQCVLAPHSSFLPTYIANLDDRIFLHHGSFDRCRCTMPDFHQDRLPIGNRISYAYCIGNGTEIAQVVLYFHQPCQRSNDPTIQSWGCIEIDWLLGSRIEYSNTGSRYSEPSYTCRQITCLLLVPTSTI